MDSGSFRPLGDAMIVDGRDLCSSTRTTFRVVGEVLLEFGELLVLYFANLMGELLWRSTKPCSCIGRTRLYSFRGFGGALIEGSALSIVCLCVCVALLSSALSC